MSIINSDNLNAAVSIAAELKKGHQARFVSAVAKEQIYVKARDAQPPRPGHARACYEAASADWRRVGRWRNGMSQLDGLIDESHQLLRKTGFSEDFGNCAGAALAFATQFKEAVSAGVAISALDEAPSGLIASLGDALTAAYAAANK